MKKLLFYILCILPFLWGCNNEDDIDKIFISGTWYVVNYFTKADWDKRNGEPVYKQGVGDTGDIEALKVISTFTLTFKNDGSYEGTMQNATFNGTWNADAKDRSFHMTINGNPSISSRLNKEFIETLKEVAFYQGDSNVLMLGPTNKRSYIQFRHK